MFELYSKVEVYSDGRWLPGVLTRNDGSSVPYFVEGTGCAGWYRKDEVRAILAEPVQVEYRYTHELTGEWSEWRELPLDSTHYTAKFTGQKFEFRHAKEFKPGYFQFTGQDADEHEGATWFEHAPNDLWIRVNIVPVSE